MAGNAVPIQDGLPAPLKVESTAEPDAALISPGLLPYSAKEVIDMDVPTTITLSGPAARAERQRLLADGREVDLVCRRRDSTGKDVSRVLFFGRCGECAWVASRAFKNRHDICIEIAFLDEAQELFALYIERVMLMVQLVDPSPLSPEVVDLNPSIKELVEDLKAEFGIEIDPWAG